jgi:hypothetical protein
MVGPDVDVAPNRKKLICDSFIQFPRLERCDNVRPDHLKHILKRIIDECAAEIKKDEIHAWFSLGKSNKILKMSRMSAACIWDSPQHCGTTAFGCYLLTARELFCGQ